MLLAVMAALAITMILSAVAVREWAQVVRRDNEAEMMFRAQDLVRGMRRFQRDKGRLPNELKELLEPGSKRQYFVRQLWKDPLVKDGKWQLLFAGPQGGLLDPSVAPVDGSADTGTGAASTGGLPSSGFAKGKGIGGGIGGAGALGSGEPTGLPIAGVKSKCTERPFRVYKQKTQYADWVFSVFDLDQQNQGAAPGAPNPNQPRPGVPGGQNLQNPGATFPPR